MFCGVSIEPLRWRHLRCSEVQRPPCDEAVLGCQESYGSDPYSPQISSCSSTKGEFSSQVRQLSTGNKGKKRDPVCLEFSPIRYIIQKKGNSSGQSENMTNMAVQRLYEVMGSQWRSRELCVKRLWIKDWFDLNVTGGTWSGRSGGYRRWQRGKVKGQKVKSDVSEGSPPDEVKEEWVFGWWRWVRWSITCSMVVVTARGDGSAELSDVSVNRRRSTETKLKPSGFRGALQVDGVLLGWTVCWCSGCAAWTETRPCRSQACGSSSGHPCTSPTRRFTRTKTLTRALEGIHGFYWKSMTLKVAVVQSNDVERCRDVEHQPH